MDSYVVWIAMYHNTHTTHPTHAHRIITTTTPIITITIWCHENLRKTIKHLKKSRLGTPKSGQRNQDQPGSHQRVPELLKTSSSMSFYPKCNLKVGVSRGTRGEGGDPYLSAAGSADRRKPF